MDRLIKNKRLAQMLEAEGLSEVLLYKGTGYFYLSAKEGTPLEEKLLNKTSTSIYVASFKQLSLQQWLEEIKHIIF